MIINIINNPEIEYSENSNEINIEHNNIINFTKNTNINNNIIVKEIKIN